MIPQHQKEFIEKELATLQYIREKLPEVYKDIEWAYLNDCGWLGQFYVKLGKMMDRLEVRE